MDQNTVVIDALTEREKGDALIRALVDAKFPVDIAFWAQVEGDDRRFLYVASPDSAAGKLLAYHALSAAIRRTGSPALWRDSFDIKLVSPAHPMAVEARGWRNTIASVLDPDSPEWDGEEHSTLHRMISLNEPTLGGYGLTGPAYIFPPYPPGLATPG